MDFCKFDDRLCENRRTYYFENFEMPNKYHDIKGGEANIYRDRHKTTERKRKIPERKKSSDLPPQPSAPDNTTNPNRTFVRFPKRITPTLKEMPFEARQKANMILGSREYLRKGNLEAAQSLMDERNVGVTIDPELSTKESLVLIDENGKVTIAYRGTEPGTNKASRVDIMNDARTAFGVESFPESEAQYQRTMEKFGAVNEVTGFSLGANRALTVSQKYGVKATLFNPWLGPKTLSKGIGRDVKIYRTTEDYASAIGMGAKNLSSLDVDTIHPIQEVQKNPLVLDVHSIENFSEQSPRIATSHAEDIHTMMKTATQHQDYVTLHEISKAIENGQSFTEWMQANEPADVTPEGFTERVNKGDFRARYWEQAGGQFTEVEQAHLDSVAAADIPNEAERSRQRARFVSKPVEEQAERLKKNEAKVKATIDKVNATTEEHHTVLKEYTKAGQFLKAVHPVNLGTGLVTGYVADKIVNAIDKDHVQPDQAREVETGLLAGAGGVGIAAAATGTALTTAAVLPEIVAGGVGFLAGAETTKGIDAGLKTLGTDKDVSEAVSSTLGGAVGAGVAVGSAIGGVALLGAEIGEFGGPIGLVIGTGVGATIGFGSWLVGKII